MRYIALSALVFALAANAAASDTPNIGKQPPAQAARTAFIVQPGEIARWRSPVIGEIRTMRVRVNGQRVSYNLAPKTGRCVAYIYGAGVVIRVTDCAKGRRVPYLRARATSAALTPARVTLRLN